MWIEELKSGKFQFYERYTDYLTGKKRRVSVTLDKNNVRTRKLALQILNEKIAKRTEPKSKNAKDITLKQLVKEYRNYQSGKVKESTYRRNYHSNNTLLKILGEDTKVSRLTKLYIENQFKTKGDSNATINERLIRFKALIRWGYKNELVEDISFLDKIEPFKDIYRKQKIQDKYLEAKELKKLVDGMEIKVWALMTQFLALSGLRIGEAIALEKTDLDLKNNIMSITKTYDPNNAVITSTKTQSSTREVFINDELKVICRKIKVLMIEQKFKNGYPNNNLFICCPEGKHIRYDAYRKYLREHSEKLIGRVITPHLLRHTHASLLLENGVSEDTISRRLGHENSRITKEIYLHITEKIKQKDNDQIAKVKIM